MHTPSDMPDAIDEVEESSALVRAQRGVHREAVDEAGCRQEAFLVGQHEVEHGRVSLGGEDGEGAAARVGMERDLFREPLVSRGRPREVLQNERIAHGIAQDLDQDLRGDLAEAVLRVESNGLVGVVAEVEIEASEDRARHRKRAACRRGAERKRRAPRENPLEDHGELGARRCPCASAHAAPPTVPVGAGASKERNDLKREASGP